MKRNRKRIFFPTKGPGIKRKLLALLLVVCLGLSITPMVNAAGTVAKGSKEYEELEQLLIQFWWGHPENYDCTSGKNGDLLKKMLQNPSCYISSAYPYNTGTYSWDNKDPLGRWPSYASVSELQVDWVLRNIFNCPESEITAMKTSFLSQNDDSRYYLNGFYYYIILGVGGPQTIQIESIQSGGENYQVTWSLRYGDNTPAEKFYSAVVSRKTIDGKAYWSLYSQKELTANESPQDTFWFPDVKESDYFYKPVKWAYEQKITQGNNGNFLPQSTCNIGEVLTFIWRAAGSPEPTISNPFQNIKPGTYYYKAALWAYQTGMFQSTLASPSTPCSRFTVVNLLWKMKGSPIVDTVVYSDVPSESSYSKSVSWAVRSGITTGLTATTFSPDSTCTRAQVVTFLYRCFVEPSAVKLPVGVPAETSQGTYSGWSAAYKDFVVNEKFLTTKYPYENIGDTYWSSASNHEISLHDLDSDGTPELFISNGFMGRLDNQVYVYTYAGGQIQYIGTAFPYGTFIPGSKYPGLFVEMSAGYEDHSLIYYYKSGNKLVSETVYTYSLANEANKTRITQDQALFTESQKSKQGVIASTSTEIKKTGWENFASTALK